MWEVLCVGSVIIVEASLLHEVELEELGNEGHTYMERVRKWKAYQQGDQGSGRMFQ